MVANGLGFSILNFPLQSSRTVDGEDFVIKQFSGYVSETTLGVVQLSSVRTRLVVQRFIEFCVDDVSQLRVPVAVAA
jgi:hypothetical protein